MSNSAVIPPPPPPAVPGTVVVPVAPNTIAMVIPPPPPSGSEVCEASALLIEAADVPVAELMEEETDEGRTERYKVEIDTFVAKCLNNYEYFAESCLKIKTKTKGIQPLIFNVAQQYLNAIAQQMIDKYGMVRIVIVKGRQQGLSTWVEGRGYWKTSQHEGVKAYILAHEGEATKNLFNMAKRYHDNCPAEMKPLTKKSNAKELLFHELDSEYAVGTAKTGDTGRSQTIQFFHGSEVAYWAAAEEISSGAMEGIPEEPDTEVYMESTAAGPGNYFHGLWQNGCYAEDEPHAHWNGYWRVFIPWYWEPSYRRKPPETFDLTEEESTIIRLHKLDLEQMAWRRHKISNMKGDVSRFQRDYPMTAAEAFNSSLSNVLIKPEVALTAMQAGRDEVYAPIGKAVLGVDVAREGDDDTTLVLRQGRTIVWYTRLSKKTTLEVAGAVVTATKTFHVDHICIDSTGGYGAGVFDVLVGWGYGQKVTPVNFAERAIDDDRYKNRRTEMYWLLKEWLERGAGIPNRDEWLTELCAITYKHEPTTDKLMLERKDEIRKRIGKSTDITDGAALTFCMPSIIMSDSSESFDPFREYGVV